MNRVHQRRHLIGALLLSTAAALCAPLADSAGAEPQPEPGVAVYAASCLGCHGEHLQGGQFGPPLRGAGFAATWAMRRDLLLDFVSKRMPPNASGSLSSADYVAVVDYIFAVSARAKAEQRDIPSAGPHPLGPNAFHDAVYDHEVASKGKLLAGLTTVTPEMLRTPPAADWLGWRRTQDDSGFSPLAQIDRSSVKRLQLKWSWSLAQGRNEIAPIVHDGVMFVNSGSVVEALDAATGTQLWRYVRDIPPEYRGPLNMVQRSIAVQGHNLLVPTADRHLVALDMASGKVVWDTQVVPNELARAVLSAGPAVAGNVIVQGTSISALTPGGSFIVGIDASNGKILWRFNNVAADHSWNGTPVGERTGGAVWSAPSYDAEAATVFYGTGGTYDLSRLLRTGPAGESDNALYTNSTIALDPATGNLRWFHQHIGREVWDLDEAFERILLTAPVGGRDRPMLVTVGKMGIIDALDRESGDFLFSIDLGLTNIVKAIDPRTGHREVDPAKVPQPNRPINVCPSVQGARNWMATAYNAASHTLYLPLQDLCMDYVWSDPGGEFDSTVDNGWTLKAAPGSNGLHGRIQAIDLVTRRTRWIVRSRAVPASSLLATAGGLLFVGATDRTFQALDADTGKTLWQTRLASAPNATPVTFSVEGRQYVAIVSGAAGDQALQTEQVTPEQQRSAPATTIYVFGL